MNFTPTIAYFYKNILGIKRKNYINIYINLSLFLENILPYFHNIPVL